MRMMTEAYALIMGALDSWNVADLNLGRNQGFSNIPPRATGGARKKKLAKRFARTKGRRMRRGR